MDVGQIHIHTINLVAGVEMALALRTSGYAVVRSYALTIWTRLF